MIFITAKFRVKPGDADRWPEIVRDFTRATRSEPGCLWFDWARSIDDPSEYVLVEAFRDGEAAGAHVSSEHFRSAQQTLPAHLVETPRIINMTIPQDDWSRLGEMEVTGHEVDPATQSWHQPLVHIAGEELTAGTAQSPGMLRLEAISGQRVGAEHIWMGRTHVAAGPARPTITTVFPRRRSTSFPVILPSFSTTVAKRCASKPNQAILSGSRHLPRTVRKTRTQTTKRSS